MKFKIIVFIVLAALSNSLTGCSGIVQKPVSTTDASMRPIPVADANQALLSLMQQQTLSNAVDNLINGKCEQRRELSCNEIILLYERKCENSSNHSKQLKPLPATFIYEEGPYS